LNYHTGGFSGSNLFQQEEERKNGVKVELYLVIVMKNTGPFRFKCTQIGVASAMILFLDLGYVERKLAEGDRFVHTVWTKGHVLRKKSTFKPNFALGDVDWKKEYGEIGGVIDMTKHVIGEIRDPFEIGNADVEVNYCVLKSTLEAAVISYLRCAVGYVPKDVPLRHLIDWTGVVDRQLIEFLYSKCELEYLQLGIFLRSEELWTQPKFDTLYADSFLDVKKVRRHLIFFQKLLDGVLRQLKRLAEPETVGNMSTGTIQ